MLGIPVGTYKRILLVVIETLENIMKHSENGNQQVAHDESTAPVLSVIKNGEQFQVISSNLINQNIVKTLKHRIDFLNTLDQQGIKDYYKETITNGVFTKTGGAGLGLIEIARISGKRIDYEFMPVDNQYVRYTQFVTISAMHP